MIRVDRFEVDDALSLSKIALLHSVPGNASVNIRTDGAGTHIIFEWVHKPI
jgi:hypothetical protein